MSVPDDPEEILERESAWTRAATEFLSGWAGLLAGLTITILAPLAGVGASTLGWPEPVQTTLVGGPPIAVLLYWAAKGLSAIEEAV